MSDFICENPKLNSPLNSSSKDKFIMVLNMPYILKKYAETDDLLNIDSLQTTVFGTIVPTINVPPVEVRFGGQSTNVSSHSRPNYEPLNVNFIIDNQYKNYYVLWKWLDILNDSRNSSYGGSSSEIRATSNLSNIAEYQTTLSIMSLDEYNEPVIAFNYHNAFITSLGSITYSYRDGEILESSAQFSFGQLSLVNQKKINTF